MAIRAVVFDIGGVLEMPIALLEAQELDLSGADDWLLR